MPYTLDDVSSILTLTDQDERRQAIHYFMDYLRGSTSADDFPEANKEPHHRLPFFLIKMAIQPHFIEENTEVELLRVICRHRPEWIDVKTATGMPLLHLLVGKDHFNSLKVLIEEGSNPATLNDGNLNVLDVLVQHWHTSETDKRKSTRQSNLIELMIETGKISPRRLGTALNIAVRRNNLEAVKTLLELGASPDIWDYNAESIRCSILCLASEIRGKEANKVLDLLLRHPKTPSLLNQGWSLGQLPPVVVAARADNFDALSRLIEAGADINPPKQTDFEGTPLIVAALKRNLGMIELTLALGANPALVDYSYQRTSLHMLAESHIKVPVDQLKACAWALMNAGTDPKAQDINGETALDIARRRAHWELVDTIQPFMDKLEIETNTQQPSAPNKNRVRL